MPSWEKRGGPSCAAAGRNNAPITIKAPTARTSKQVVMTLSLPCAGRIERQGRAGFNRNRTMQPSERGRIWRDQDPLEAAMAPPRSSEEQVARIDRGSVEEGYHLVGEAVAGVHLPVHGIHLREVRAGPIADELEAVSWRRSGAVEVHHRVPIRFTALEHDQVIAAA